MFNAQGLIDTQNEIWEAYNNRCKIVAEYSMRKWIEQEAKEMLGVVVALPQGWFPDGTERPYRAARVTEWKLEGRICTMQYVDTGETVYAPKFLVKASWIHEEKGK